MERHLDDEFDRDDSQGIVDWAYFEKARAELGPGFIRILTYFREDGEKSVERIERAMHSHKTVELVMPAHTLKGESRQFGAEPLAEVAERIENVARICIETHRFPDELIPDVVELRRMFDLTVDLFDRATNPLKTRGANASFGRRSASNQEFGRI
jgi:HPt (histidine-containing phosphotransfer) domain-containing protein